MNRNYSRAISLFILFSVAFIIYSRTFHSPYYLDDHKYICLNQSIRDIRNLCDIWKFWPTRFITFLSFAVNYRFGQLDVFGYHLANLFIHICSESLVWWLSLMTFSMPLMRETRIHRFANIFALFAALIFVSHPIQTESVTYIYQRATSLAGFFYLLSLCLYIKARILQEENNKSIPSDVLLLFSWIIALIAMFTKENTFTLPLMIILYEFSLFSNDRVKRRYIVPFLILLFVIPILLFFKKPLTFEDIQRLVNNPIVAGWQYFLTQLRVIATYIRLLFVPLNQSLAYDYRISKTLFELPVIASALFLTVILIFAFRLFHKYRLISFSIFWFFIILIPDSSIIPLKDVIFEHRLYLSVVGYSIFLIGIVDYILGNRDIKKVFLVLLIITIGYSTLTYMRNSIWSNELMFWNDAVCKSPNKARVYYGRAIAYQNIGEFHKAIADYNKVLNAGPEYHESYYDRGNAYSDKGDFDQAISDYNKALQLFPNMAEIYNNRGLAYHNKGDIEHAISDYNRAIELSPNLAEAYNNRAIAYFSKHEYKKSQEDAMKAEALGFKTKR